MACFLRIHTFSSIPDNFCTRSEWTVHIDSHFLIQHFREDLPSNDDIWQRLKSFFWFYEKGIIISNNWCFVTDKSCVRFQISSKISGSAGGDGITQFQG